MNKLSNSNSKHACTKIIKIKVHYAMKYTTNGLAHHNAGITYVGLWYDTTQSYLVSEHYISFPQKEKKLHLYSGQQLISYLTSQYGTKGDYIAYIALLLMWIRTKKYNLMTIQY
jgi:hypothetical protein